MLHTSFLLPFVSSELTLPLCLSPSASCVAIVLCLFLSKARCRTSLANLNSFFIIIPLCDPFRVSTLAIANSISAAKTNTKQVAIHMSIALVYDTRGSDAFTLELWVEIVRTDKTPRVTLPGTEFTFNQKDTHDNMTISRVGMYIWTT